MALNDPIAVYNAENNLEAQLICNLLNDTGIEAYLTEDVSQVGVWLLGLVPEIHKPQVWTDRGEIDRVKPLLEDFERRKVQRQQAANDTMGETVVEATCEKCGQRSNFAAAQQGTVQDCPHCGAFMDVGDSPDADEWWREDAPGESV